MTLRGLFPYISNHTFYHYLSLSPCPPPPPLWSCRRRQCCLGVIIFSRCAITQHFLTSYPVRQTYSNAHVNTHLQTDEQRQTDKDRPTEAQTQSRRIFLTEEELSVSGQSLKNVKMISPLTLSRSLSFIMSLQRNRFCLLQLFMHI